MSKRVPWIIKYAPKNSSEIINQNEAVAKIKDFILNFKKYKKKALLLYGPPGTGKTSSVHAIAKELNYEVIELNASDVRTGRAITDKYKEVANILPFFYKGRIILIDEVDGITNRERGGVTSIIKIIKDAKWPVILTANDPWDPKLRQLRNECELVEFKKLTSNQIYIALKKIASLEKLDVDDNVLKAIADRSDGDLRSAINDLEILSYKGGRISMKDLEILGYRDRQQTIFAALATMFKAQTITGATYIFSNVDMDPEEIQSWVEQNISEEYERLDEIYEAYNWLGIATIFRSRIYKRQYWELLKYYTTLMYAGVALSKRERYKKFTKYKMPSYVRILANTKEIRDKIGENLSKYKQKVHASTKRIRDVYISILFNLYMKDEKLGNEYAEKLGLKDLLPYLEKLNETIKQGRV